MSELVGVSPHAARALLMDVHEAMEEGLSELWEVVEHFGVPEEVAWLQPPLPIE